MHSSSLGKYITIEAFFGLSSIDDGASSKLIASSLGISIHTVSRHRQNILSKFRAANSAQAL